MSEVKFTVKSGTWEISYEGGIEYLSDGFFSVVQQILTIPELAQSAAVYNSETNESVTPEQVSGSAVPQMTMNTLCAKLNCQTGPDLVAAACVFLTFVRGQELLARAEIAQAMRDASRYFKDTIVSNLTAYLQTLVKAGKLIERKDNIYVLSAKYAMEVEAHLV